MSASIHDQLAALLPFIATVDPSKEEQARIMEDLYGVSINVLVHLGCLYEDDDGYQQTNKLKKSAHIIKAIRNDPTGLTAAMYGIEDKE